MRHGVQNDQGEAVTAEAAHTNQVRHEGLCWRCEKPLVDPRPTCWRCEKVLAEYVSRPWKFVCVRCKAVNNNPKD